MKSWPFPTCINALMKQHFCNWSPNHYHCKGIQHATVKIFLPWQNKIPHLSDTSGIHRRLQVLRQEHQLLILAKDPGLGSWHCLDFSWTSCSLMMLLLLPGKQHKNVWRSHLGTRVTRNKPRAKGKRCRTVNVLITFSDPTLNLKPSQIKPTSTRILLNTEYIQQMRTKK